VSRESGSNRNVGGGGGNRKVVRATLAAPRKGNKQVNRLGWWSILIGIKQEPGWPWGDTLQTPAHYILIAIHLP
jgi:hypothetical protein